MPSTSRHIRWGDGDGFDPDEFLLTTNTPHKADERIAPMQAFTRRAVEIALNDGPDHTFCRQKAKGERSAAPAMSKIHPTMRNGEF
jgi:hypothetical protein